MPIIRLLQNEQKVSSFNYVVGATEHQGRNGEIQRLGCPEIDDQLILGRKLRRQVGGLCALEDAIYI
jgi:hypothetical protein